MKKKYVTPDLELALFETDKEVMDSVVGSAIDPYSVGNKIDWWNFPNGTQLNEDGTPK